MSVTSTVHLLLTEHSLRCFITAVVVVILSAAPVQSVYSHEEQKQKQRPVGVVAGAPVW
eukprot:COSAG02_NODE_4038_length_5874_cov_2.627661_1_plen_58_part_10